MKLIVYSQITAARIAASMGLPEYSYYFVLRDFLPVLRELGEVLVVEDPATEVDALYDKALAQGQHCWFLSFTPPQKTLFDLRCPTIPVFAWEFYGIPNEFWLDEPWQDWRYVLGRCGRAITHSRLIVDMVRRDMDESFPVISVPSPVWDKFEHLRQQPGRLPLNRSVKVHLPSGVIVDSSDPQVRPYISGEQAMNHLMQAIRQFDRTFSPRDQIQETAPQVAVDRLPRQSAYRITRRYLGEWYLRVLRPLISPRAAMQVLDPQMQLVVDDPDRRPEPRNPVEPRKAGASGLSVRMPDWQPASVSTELSGVVFTALFNPYDGRKNWADMLTAFCAAFRDTPDATLAFKLGHTEYLSAMQEMLIWLARMPVFQCRIVIMHGYLEGNEFDELIRATAFTVNASHGEGQCLPLMEFMSCGKPAVAPRHSAMLDYIDEEVAFVVDSWLDATAWSHDPRLAYRTLRHQINWSSLKQAYLDAYACVRQDPERYRRMSAAAITRMKGHCSRAVAKERLASFLDIPERQAQ
jgi:glycosyltransferase involved in cell wall biosynthesis